MIASSHPLPFALLQIPNGGTYLLDHDRFLSCSTWCHDWRVSRSFSQHQNHKYLHSSLFCLATILLFLTPSLLFIQLHFYIVSIFVPTSSIFIEILKFNFWDPSNYFFQEHSFCLLATVILFNKTPPEFVNHFIKYIEFYVGEDDL